MMRLIKQNWFLIALAGICVVTLIDVTGTIAGMGKWFKSHSGADAVICTIFFCSGLILKREEIRAGLRDTRGAVIALVIIFTIAPLAAYVIGKLPLDPAVRIGLFLVACLALAACLEVLSRYAEKQELFSVLITDSISILAFLVFAVTVISGILHVCSIPRIRGAIILGVCLIILHQGTSLFYRYGLPACSGASSSLSWRLRLRETSLLGSTRNC